MIRDQPARPSSSSTIQHALDRALRADQHKTNVFDNQTPGYKIPPALHAVLRGRFSNQSVSYIAERENGEQNQSDKARDFHY